jgi:hypothetical protein
MQKTDFGHAWCWEERFWGLIEVRQPKLLSFHPSHTIVMSCDALLYEDVNVSDK